MDLFFLGTGAGTPSRERNVTSIVFNAQHEAAECWLFDCGEGTQHQLIRSPVRLSKIQKMFVTHLHGDHIFGIPGFLTSRANQGAESAFQLFGPPGIRSFVETALQVSGAHLIYDLTIHEIETGIVFEDEFFRVSTLPLVHRIECFGFRIEEKDRPGRLMVDKLQQQGVPSGPLYGRLKQGESIHYDGSEYHPEDYVGEQIRGRTVTILGDTRPCDAVLRLAQGADALVHEATFSEQLQDRAEKYFHSTAVSAATAAKKAGAGALIMTHLSARYQGNEQLLLDEARQIFPNAFIAKDFWKYELNS